MKVIQIIIALTIYLILPLTGLLWFLRLKKQMKEEDIPNAPITELFIIFSTYGGLLQVALTSVIWPLDWSGMASLGTFYLIIGAPFVMGAIAYRNRHKKALSKYHNWTFFSGLSYFIIAPVTFFVLYLVAIH